MVVKLKFMVGLVMVFWVPGVQAGQQHVMGRPCKTLYVPLVLRNCTHEGESFASFPSIACSIQQTWASSTPTALRMAGRTWVRTC